MTVPDATQPLAPSASAPSLPPTQNPAAAQPTKPQPQHKPADPDAPFQDPSEMPRDAKLVSLILDSMDVDEYDPKVVPQLLEFMHRYVIDVLGDAQLFADHAGHKEIEMNDISLAIEGRVAHSFTSPPGKDILSEIAEKKNSIPLPLIQERYGLRLPPERHLLTNTNFQIIPQKIAGRPPPQPQAHPTPSAANPTLQMSAATAASLPQAIFQQQQQQQQQQMMMMMPQMLMHQPQLIQQQPQPMNMGMGMGVGTGFGMGMAAVPQSQLFGNVAAAGSGLGSTNQNNADEDYDMDGGSKNLTRVWFAERFDA
ncbi:Transcription initiation factor TFIID subunit 9 [Borealophlyctis nickersoniae]|nr:Transcription initiation factor TFIID subunit 9 [Borealophlyctis nickersoniae]